MRIQAGNLIGVVKEMLITESKIMNYERQLWTGGRTTERQVIDVAPQNLG